MSTPEEAALERRRAKRKRYRQNKARRKAKAKAEGNNEESHAEMMRDPDYARGFMMWADDLPDGAWQAAHEEAGLDVCELYIPDEMRRRKK